MRMAIGNGFGHPKTDGSIKSYLSVDDTGWGFATPGQYLCCAKTGDGIFETTFYFHANWGCVAFYQGKTCDWSLVLCYQIFRSKYYFNRWLLWTCMGI